MKRRVLDRVQAAQAMQGHFPHKFGGMVHIGIGPHLAFMIEVLAFLDGNQSVADRVSQRASAEIGGGAVVGHDHVEPELKCLGVASAQPLGAV